MKNNVFFPRDGARSNMNNALGGVRADEVHCLRHAALAHEEGNFSERDYFYKEADSARTQRLKMLEAVGWHPFLDCRLKHKLDDLVNTEEAIMKAVHQKKEVSALLEHLRDILRKLDEIEDKMEAKYKEEQKSKGNSG